MGFVLALLALLLYSTNIIVTKLAGGKLDLDLGVSVAASANVLFGLVLLGAQVASKGPLLNPDATALCLFMVAGFFSTYLGRWFFFATVAKLGPAKASAFQITNPLFTVVIAWGCLGERLQASDLGAVAVTLVGLYLVSYVGPARKGGSRWLAWTSAFQAGALVALGSSSSYAVANVLRGAAVRRWDEPIVGTLLGAAVGMVIQVAVIARHRNVWQELRAAPRTGVAYYGLIGLLTVGAQVCVIASMASIPVGVANLITMSTPILVTPASYFLLKNQEGLTAKTVVGIALVLVGIGAIVLL